jgi:hypothetical protein
MTKQARQQKQAGRAATKNSGAPPLKPTPSGVEGEGSYTATRRYNEHLGKHLESHDVEGEAKAAREALEGDEREELEAAERRGKQGPSGHQKSAKR